MQKALGITAFVLSIVAIFTPVLGPYMTVLIAIMAIFAAGAGFSFGIAAIIINIFNILILSPQTWMFLGGASGNDAFITALVWILSQVIALPLLIMRNKKKKVRSNESTA